MIFVLDIGLPKLAPDIPDFRNPNPASAGNLRQNVGPADQTHELTVPPVPL